MATRYAKVIGDTVEYYDSREEMEAANPEVSTRELLSCVAKVFNPLFAIVGFIVGGLATLFVFSSRGEFKELATWIKFCAVFLSALSLGYLSGKLGNAVFMILISFAIIGAVIAAVLGVGLLTWNLLGT